MLPEDAILLPEIVDEIFLVAIHPASHSQHEEVQSVGHGRRLHGSDTGVTHVVSGIHSPRPFSRTIRGPGSQRISVNCWSAHCNCGRARNGESLVNSPFIGFIQISLHSIGVSRQFLRPRVSLDT